MDKTLSQNENTSPVKPNTLETEHAVVVKTKSIDVLSLPQKKSLPQPEKDKKNPSLDEQSLDENWLQLSQDWQSQPYEKTDIQALLKQTKKRTLQAKSLLAIDVLATLGSFIALLVGFYQGNWATATLAFLAFGSIISVIFVYYEVKIRLRIWQHSCDSPDKAIANAIVGVKSSIQYIKLTKLSCWLFLPAANGYVYAMMHQSEKSSWPSFLFINMTFLIMWLIANWFHKKRSKELLQLNSV